MKIKLIPKDEIDLSWPLIEEWVRNALGEDKSYSVEDVKTACKTHMELRLIYADELKGFLISTVYDTPQCKVCYAPWLGGKDLDQWVFDAFNEFKTYLKSIGCKQYSFIGRKAWHRLIKADYEGQFYLIIL